MLLNIFSWAAIVLLSVSYWFQIWKIHIHKEVRSISLPYNILLGIGFATLAVTAYQEKSLIFFVKQVATTIPVVIIVFQVLYHKNDTWHDKALQACQECSHEIEKPWGFCPYCGNRKEKALDAID